MNYSADFRIPILRNILLTVLFITILFTLSSLLFPIPSFAQCLKNDRNQGLISATGGISGMFGTSAIGADSAAGVCITGSDASYRPIKVPSYQDLEDQFYTFNRSGAKKSTPLPDNLNFTGAGKGVYLNNADLVIDTVNNPSGPVGIGAQVIFVRGNLDIKDNITFAETDSSSGLVFIVQKDINIYSNVTKVNGVLISLGIICTSYISGSGCSDGSLKTEQLIINGSLISLNKNSSLDSPLQLRRNLEDNDLQPAEVVNKQPKYLYILKDGLFTKDLIITTEDQHYQITPPAP